MLLRLKGMSINLYAQKTEKRNPHSPRSPFHCVFPSIDMNANTESVSSLTRNCNQKQLFRVRCGIISRRNEQDCNTIFNRDFVEMRDRVGGRFGKENFRCGIEA